MERINLDAAGIDIGASGHFVAVPEDRDEKPVREFAACTADLYQLADSLKACGIKTVAMESTWVYWIPLFQVLEERGFEVRLVDARRVKNVSGRKTDVPDCQWLQQLHTYGLLSSAFRPDDDTCVLRSHMRQRDGLVIQAGQHMQHMQKALELMNVKLTEVLADVSGQTGMAIIDDILAGQRDPKTLAKHRHTRCKHDEETIARALTGRYRPEHLFALRQAVTLYRQCQDLIRECDTEIERFLEERGPKDDGTPTPPERSSARSKNALGFDAHGHLFRLVGVDLTAIPELSTASVLALLAAKSALGASYRRMRSRLGAPKAITATAHKLARLFYSMLRTKTSFADIGQDAYDRTCNQRRFKGLAKAAEQLGFKLVPATA